MVDSLRDQLEADEGVRARPYKDIYGNITIGIGRNLDGNGLSPDEIDYLYQNDIKRCKADLSKCDWYSKQPESIRNAIMNMCFNMGINKLLGFKKMILALDVKDYQRAANAALDSLWAHQVPLRAKRIAAIIREGR